MATATKSRRSTASRGARRQTSAMASSPRSKRQTSTRRGGTGTRSRSSSSSSGRRGGSAESTQDLETIRQWAEARGGKPATVRSTARGKEAGILRIDFPGYSGQDSLEEIPWDEWYEKFQENNLTFLYQDKTASGKQSRFFKLVCAPNAKSAKG
jgi:hypothetical protein